MAKFKFPTSELNEHWWLETADCVMAGYTYRRHRVFVVCAKNRADAIESMKEFKERSCK